LEHYETHFSRYFFDTLFTFQPRLDGLRVDRITFFKVIVSVFHYIYYAGFNFDRDETRQVFPKEQILGHWGTSPTKVPFGELFAVFGLNATDPTYEHLLFGAVLRDVPGPGAQIIRYGLGYLAKELPRGLLQTHSDVLITALSFLCSVGAINIERGTYRSSRPSSPSLFARCGFPDTLAAFRNWEHAAPHYHPNLRNEERETFFFSISTLTYNIAWLGTAKAIRNDILLQGHTLREHGFIDELGDTEANLEWQHFTNVTDRPVYWSPLLVYNQERVNSATW
jgi:hypothetical protein